jgi:replicative DNA helicase
MHLNESALYAELNRLRNENKNGNNKHNILDNNKNELEFKKGDITSEIYLLNICIYYFKKAENIFEFVEPSDFSNEIHIRIADIIKKSVKEKKTITAGEIIGFFEKDDEKSKVAEIFSQKLPEIDLDSLIKSSVEKVKQSISSKKIQIMIEEMDKFYQAGQKEEANKIFVEIKEMQKKKR